MRGTWQGSGTWETTSGSSPAPLILGAVAAVAVIELAEFILARIWWLLGATAVIVAIIVAAVLCLIRAQARREAVHAAERPFLARREAAVITAAVQRELPAAPVIHLHFHTADAEESAARIIRNAVHGQSVDAITEGN